MKGTASDSRDSQGGQKDLHKEAGCLTARAADLSYNLVRRSHEAGRASTAL